MAGLPLDRPIPGVPLLDPLGQEVHAPIPEPAPPPAQPMLFTPPVADELAGAPQPYGVQELPPWPPAEFTGGQPAGPVGNVDQQGNLIPRDVPVVEDQNAAPAGLNEAPRVSMRSAKPAPAPRQDPGQAQLDANAEAHANAVREAAIAEEQKNDFLASEGVRAAEDANQKQMAADSAFMQAQDEAKTKRAQLDQEALAIANQQIDPKRAWHDASFGAKLAMGVSAIVQGFVTGPTSGANPIIAMIQSLNEQDMKAQEANLANRTSTLNIRRGLLAEDVAAGRDILDFQYKSLGAAYTMAENQIKAYALKYDNPIITASAQEKLAQINDARTKMGMEYEGWKTDQWLKKQQVAQGWAHVGIADRAEKAKAEADRAKAAKGPSIRDQIAMSKEQRAQQEYMDKRLIPGVKTKEGGDYYVLDDGDARPLKDKMQMVTSMNQKFDRLEEIYGKHGWKPFGEWSAWDPVAQEDAKEARLIMGNILPEWSKANEQGVIRDKEYPMYFKMFGDPTGLLDPRTNFRKMRQMSTQQINNELRQKTRNQDAAWWEPERVAGGNDQTTDTDADAIRFRDEQKQHAAAHADRPSEGGTPRSSWEIVGQSPDGTKNMTAGGLVIPAGRSIVGQKTHVNGGGRTVDTYELDDGQTFDVEE